MPSFVLQQGWLALKASVSSSTLSPVYLLRLAAMFLMLGLYPFLNYDVEILLRIRPLGH